MSQINSYEETKTLYYSLLNRSPLNNQVVGMANNNGDTNEGIAAEEIENKFGYAVDSSKDAKYVDKVFPSKLYHSVHCAGRFGGGIVDSGFRVGFGGFDLDLAGYTYL